MAGSAPSAGPDAPVAFGPRIDRSLENVLGVLSTVLLVCLIGVTVVDVVGRYILDTPLTGAFEITQLVLLALVFTALPLATGRSDHVRVDILLFALRPSRARLLDRFAALFSAALLATFAWRLAVQAIKADADGSTTNALAVPFAPFAWLAAISCLVSAAIALALAIRSRGRETGP